MTSSKLGTMSLKLRIAKTSESVDSDQTIQVMITKLIDKGMEEGRTKEGGKEAKRQGRKQRSRREMKAEQLANGGGAPPPTPRSPSCEHSVCKWGAGCDPRNAPAVLSRAASRYMSFLC